MVTAVISALLLTACDKAGDNKPSETQVNQTTDKQITLTDPIREAQVCQAADRHIIGIEMYETGGEDGRQHHWRVCKDEKNTLVFDDLRINETKIYELSDDEYNEIIGIDFSGYINKTDDNDGVFDALYYDVTIRYDDDTEERSKASIPDLWRKFNYYLYECEPVSCSAENNTDN